MCDEKEQNFLRPCFCCSFFHHHRAYMEFWVDERGRQKKKIAKERNETS